MVLLQVAWVGLKISVEPLLRAIEIVEGAVELGFESGIENRRIGGAGGHVAGAEMAALEDWFGGFGLDF